MISHISSSKSCPNLIFSGMAFVLLKTNTKLRTHTDLTLPLKTTLALTTGQRSWLTPLKRHSTQYHGCPNIDKYLPKDSYIAIDINNRKQMTPSTHASQIHKIMQID
jgi:hypothetical protein